MTKRWKDDLIFAAAVALWVGVSMAIITCSFAGRAHAADLKTPQLYKAPPAVVDTWNWSGFYLGAYGGWGANFAKDSTLLGTTTIDLANTPNGPGFGGEAEVLYQAVGSGWVFGGSADIGWANLRANSAVAPVTGPAALSLSNATNWLGSVDAEIGYAFTPRVLGYLGGGFAFGGTHPNLQVGTLSQAISDTAVGWNIKGGFDVAVTKSLVLFIEGDYTDLGSKTLSIIPVGGGAPIVTSNVKENIFEQKGGLKVNIVPSN